MKKNGIRCTSLLLIAICSGGCFGSNATDNTSVDVGTSIESHNVERDHINVLSSRSEEGNGPSDSDISPLVSEGEDGIPPSNRKSDEDCVYDSSDSVANASNLVDKLIKPTPRREYLWGAVPVRSDYIPPEMLLPPFSLQEKFRRLAIYLLPEDMIFEIFNRLYDARWKIFVGSCKNEKVAEDEKFIQMVKYIESALIFCQQILGIRGISRMNIQDFCAFLEYLDVAGGAVNLSQEVCDRLYKVLNGTFDSSRLPYMMQVSSGTSIPQSPIVTPFRLFHDPLLKTGGEVPSDLVQCYTPLDGEQIMPAGCLGQPNSIIVGCLICKPTMGVASFLSIDEIRRLFSKAAMHVNNIRNAIILRRADSVSDCYTFIRGRRAGQDIEDRNGSKKVRTTETVR